MRNLRFSRTVLQLLLPWMVAAAALFSGWPSAAFSQAAQDPSEAEPIEITADKLVTDNTAKSADFTGNVHAVQGDTEVTAERLILFYESGGDQNASIEGGTIDRMEAFGQVRITFDNKVAVSDKAVYITKERKLILEGPGSKIVSGKDQVEGTKITFYRDSGRVALEGNADNRVKVTIHSDQRGLN